MSEQREQILREIEQHRAAILELEAQLREPRPPERAPHGWPPVGFYLTFYIVAGMLIGILGSLTSFLFNVLGSLLVKQDPLLFLRVYGTVFLGAKALTTDDLNFFMLVAVVHFSVGASRRRRVPRARQPLRPRRAGAADRASAALYGLLMWVVNFYVVIAWLQPRLVGEAVRAASSCRPGSRR